MRTSTPQAIEIYEIYPRKIAKPKALSEIMKAIDRDGFEHVSDRTKNFAERAASHDLTFIPYPATFFHQSRYNDDLEAVFPKPKQNGHEPAWQKIKRVEKLLAENLKALQRIEYPNQYLYDNRQQYEKVLHSALSKRDGLKAERKKLQEQLALLNQEM